MALNKRTPCVGICSTTYGDLVCRGCKRFAHEIVQWNGYDEAQQAKVWARLLALRADVLSHYLAISDAKQFAQACAMAGLEALQGAEQCYELLRFLVSGSRTLKDGGLTLRAHVEPAQPGRDQQEALQIIQLIDAEIYQRSVAHYERNFKVPI